MDLTDRIFNYLERFRTPASTRTFGLFRIAFAFHLLLIWTEVFRYRALIFDAIPGVSRNYFPSNLWLFIWLISILFLLAGMRTRIAAIVNYLMVVLATSLFASSSVGTFNDDLLRIGSFLCIFMPVSGRFSIDALMADMRYRSTLQTTTRLHYLLFIFLSLGLLYFPSGLTKTYSPMWMHGIGLWIPVCIPHNKWNNLPDLIANQKALLVFINYFVIIWELAFIFLIFNKKWHPYIVIPGLIFHTAIAALFPFPAVCSGPLVFYMLFIPDRWWDRISQSWRIPTPTIVYWNPNHDAEYRMMQLISAIDFRHRFQLTASSDPDNSLTYRHMISCIRTYRLWQWLAISLSVGLIRRMLQYLHTFALPPVKEATDQSAFTPQFRYSVMVYFVGFCTAMQAGISSYHVYSHFNSGAEKRMEYMRKRKSGFDFSMKPTNLVRTFLGINSRGLFLDHANSGRKTSRAIVQVLPDSSEYWLPLMDQRGHVCRELNMNMAWAKVTFNLMGFGVAPLDTSGVARITQFWCQKHQINPEGLTFRVYAKTYDYPDHFTLDYYKQLESIPWTLEGTASWTNGQFRFILSDSVKTP